MHIKAEKPFAGTVTQQQRLQNFKADIQNGKESFKLTLTMPSKMHTDFKTKCSLNNTFMKDVLIELIVKYLSE